MLPLHAQDRFEVSASPGSSQLLGAAGRHLAVPTGLEHPGNGLPQRDLNHNSTMYQPQALVQGTARVRHCSPVEDACSIMVASGTVGVVQLCKVKMVGVTAQTASYIKLQN
jgi:hypothetical protein